MSTNTNQFDAWIRSDFQAINRELEELYFARENREDVDGIGDNLKQKLVDDGKQFIVRLLGEGNTDEGFDAGFTLLGNVGMYMAACRRHGITDPLRDSKSPQKEASALAMQLGASLGVIPRFASAHLQSHNLAVNGEYRMFTGLPDEEVFFTQNTRSAFGFVRAAEALVHILPMGVSHPASYDLFVAARSALEDVIVSNALLYEKLDTDRFFYNVRPYFKPHHVGLREYRGANAGDFAGINVVDLLLGVCRADDAYYSQLLVDKFLFMRPEEQLLLRDCMRRESLLDGFLAEIDESGDCDWFQKNAGVFMEVCDKHAETAVQHHELLIEKFIEKPALEGGLQNREDLTASGPPLNVLLKSLKKLTDMRCAIDRSDIPSRYDDLQKLRDRIQ